MRKELNDGMMDFLQSKSSNTINKITPLKNTLRSITGDCSEMAPGRLSKACKAFTGEYEPKIYPDRLITRMAITKKEVRNLDETVMTTNKFGKPVRVGKMVIVKKLDIVKNKPTNSKKVPLEPKGSLEKFLSGGVK